MYMYIYTKPLYISYQRTVNIQLYSVMYMHMYTTPLYTLYQRTLNIQIYSVMYMHMYTTPLCTLYQRTKNIQLYSVDQSQEPVAAPYRPTARGGTRPRCRGAG